MWQQLPKEMLELLVKTSVALLYIRLQVRSMDADFEAMKTAMTVHSSWRDVIFESDFNRKQLRKTFNHLSSPCRCRLPAAKTLLDAQNDANCFTILDQFIYVVRGSMTKELHVFNKDDYNETYRQTLSYLAHPTSLIGVQHNNMLYIGDSANHCMWSLTPWTPGQTCDLTLFYKLNDAGHSIQSLASSPSGRLAILIKIEQFCGKTWCGKLEILDKETNLHGVSIYISDDIVNPTSVACVTGNMLAISGLGIITLMDENGNIFSRIRRSIEFPSSIRFDFESKSLFVADSGASKLLLFSVQNKKLVVRKLIKVWGDRCTNTTTIKSVAGDRRLTNHETPECDYLLQNEEKDRVGLKGKNRFHVDELLSDSQSSGNSDCSILLRPNTCNDFKRASQLSENTKQYQKRPVRVVYDARHLIVGLHSGEILAYRL